MLESREQGTYMMQDLRDAFLDRLMDPRNEGPHYVVYPLAKALHNDLAEENDVGHALRESTVLRFEAWHEDFVRIIAHEPVAMGAGGHAGMKTKRTLVVQFTARKREFGRLVSGESADEEVGEDVDMDADAERETDGMAMDGLTDADTEGQPDDPMSSGTGTIADADGITHIMSGT